MACCVDRVYTFVGGRRGSVYSYHPPPETLNILSWSVICGGCRNGVDRPRRHPPHFEQLASTYLPSFHTLLCAGHLGSARTGLGAMRGYFRRRQSTNVTSLRTARLAASFSAIMVSILVDTSLSSMSNTCRPHRYGINKRRVTQSDALLRTYNATLNVKQQTKKWLDLFHVLWQRKHNDVQTYSTLWQRKHNDVHAAHVLH